MKLQMYEELTWDANKYGREGKGLLQKCSPTYQTKIISQNVIPYCIISLFTFCWLNLWKIITTPVVFHHIFALMIMFDIVLIHIYVYWLKCQTSRCYVFFYICELLVANKRKYFQTIFRIRIISITEPINLSLRRRSHLCFVRPDRTSLLRQFKLKKTTEKYI